MFAFGHVGLTIGAAYASRLAASRWKDRLAVRSLDFRPVIVGSMLPDLIDKPLGLWLAPGLVDHSLRSIAHTLVFAAGLLGVGLAVWASGRGPRTALLAASNAGHLAMDQMWRNTLILFWPMLGWDFRALYPSFSEWAADHISDAFRVFTDYPELAGLLIIVAFVARLVYTRRARQFLASGSLP